MNDIYINLNKMTLEEKAAILAGTEFWRTNPVPRLEIPSVYMTDGPCGLRKQGDKADHLGLNQSEETTSFPAGVSIASSWNPENARLMGEAIAEECHHYGVNILLGPSVNIKKNPRCGRNFEYFSEDPYISGRMGIEFVNGVQGKGIGVSVKHYAVNNNEDFRFMGDSIVDERALREIYLKAFEMIVREAKPATVMCAYNKVNGIFCSENKQLLTEILREEWGFDGAVISDWGAVADRVKGVTAGMDLEMPGDCVEFRKNVIAAAKVGTLPIEDIDRCVFNILKLINRTKNICPGKPLEKEKNSRLSGEIAADCAVLLKNEGTLPLDTKRKYLIIGDLFVKMRYQGSGSSLINPTAIITPQSAFDQRHISYEYSRGYREAEIEPEAQYEEAAVSAAKNYDEIIFFAGQTDYTESEGYDRDSLELPRNQLSLLRRLAELRKKIIFVLYGGSLVELPFEDKLDSILNLYLPGQSGGEATAALLFGEKNPSGKLAETWPVTYQDVPFANDFISSRFELYKDSIYVGYRYYDKVGGKGVRYPFGYGLSYTKFEYSNLTVREDAQDIVVSCDIKNIGDIYGGEIAQLYVKNPDSEVFKADKELRAFTKVYLKPGETRNAVMHFNRGDLAYYHVKEKRWVLENGTYQILVAASSTDNRLEHVLRITGEPDIAGPYQKDELKEYYIVEELHKVSNATFEKLIGFTLPVIKRSEKPVTVESRFIEFRYSIVGRILYKAVAGVGERQFKRALKMPQGPQREMEKKNGMFLMRLMPNNSVRSMSASSAGRFPMKFARAFVELTNGHYISGIKYLLSNNKIPDFPITSTGNKQE